MATLCSYSAYADRASLSWLGFAPTRSVPFTFDLCFERETSDLGRNRSSPSRPTEDIPNVTQGGLAGLLTPVARDGVVA